MATVNGEPSGTQPPPSDREEEPHSSPSSPHPGGKIPQHLQANLGDLADNKLKHFMEELPRKVTLQWLKAPPETPHQHLGDIL